MNTSTLRIEEHPPITQEQEPYLENQAALEVRAVYNGVLIDTRFLSPTSSSHRSKARGLDPQTTYIIGQSQAADAPASSDLLGATDMPLVSKWGEGFLVNVTPRMTGDVAVGNKVYRLADYLAGRGSNFTLPPNARACINCGTMSFQLAHTTRAEALPKRWFSWRWDEHKFTLGSFLALALFLLMVFAIPPEGMAASGDWLSMNKNYLPSVVKAPEPEQVPEILTKQPEKKNQGNSGKAHHGESGKMGDKNSKRTNGLYAIKGDGKDMHLSKEQAKESVMKTGILGVLSSIQGSQFNSIFGRETAAGDAKEDVLGNLVANEIAGAYGAGGLGTYGTGPGGGGTGLRTIGIGNKYETIGRDYGRNAGIDWARRTVRKVRDVIPGVATTRGSLDKEIIRRVVRLHMNEVKFCYDQELSRKPGLGGRISVQFVISGAGQVINSFVQSTTMNNLRVESCVVGALKRWDFPKPEGGGIAIVSYPFNFVAGSGG